MNGSTLCYNGKVLHSEVDIPDNKERASKLMLATKPKAEKAKPPVNIPISFGLIRMKRLISDQLATVVGVFLHNLI